MEDILGRLFEADRYMKRFQCGGWERSLVWVHVVADLLIWAAYMAIPVAIIYYIRKRKYHIPYPIVFWGFTAFILFCGWSHFWDAVMPWWPAYRWWALVKLATAAVSWVTVVMVIRVLPAAILMKTPEELEKVVAERTSELENVNAKLEEMILERDAAIRRLTEQDIALKRLMDANIIGIGITTLDGKIVQANDYCSRVLGKADANELKLKPEQLPLDRAAIEEAVAKGYCTPYEKEYLRPDGSRVPVLMAFALVGEDKAICYVKDITKQKSLEQELRKRIEELMDADVRKNEFVAMLAHELRNPLAPILNAVPLLKRVTDQSDPRITKIVDMVERNVGAMSRIIEDLLDVSRITGGQVVLRKEIVNIKAVIENSVDCVRTLTQQKGHALTVALPAEKVLVAGDMVRLEQIFTNLIQNAVKYTDRGGAIQITATADATHVTASIKDNGIGIDPSIQELIWDLFGQAERSLERSQGGLGLGLTIVKKLVELHGGTVSVKSEGTNHGSEFIITLPKLGAKMATADHGKSGNTPEAAKNMNVLVVDDNVDATDSLAMFLEMCGHTVAVVFDGNKALDITSTTEYDVILLDIGLPGANGYEVCKTLRERGCKSHIIAITGYGQDEDKAKSKEVGFNRHLVKPVNPDLVEECLASLGKYARGREGTCSSRRIKP